MIECNCPHCRASRGFDEVSTGDFMAQARIVAGRSFPAFQRMTESLYAEGWKQTNVTPACFLMLSAAALFHEAVATMAKESRRPVDIKSMLLGFKAFGLTFDFMVDVQSDGILIESSGSVDPEDQGVRH